MNIQLPYPKIPIFPPTTPFPWLPRPENLRLPPPGQLSFPPSGNNNLQQVSLIPYIRRLICMGLDTDLNLEKFFGSGCPVALVPYMEEKDKTTSRLRRVDAGLK